MTREELTRAICPSFMRSKCGEQVDCNYCNEIMNKWLEEYNKQIRAEVIEECVNNSKHTNKNKNRALQRK